MSIKKPFHFAAFVFVGLALPSLVLARAVYPLKYALFDAHQAGGGASELARVALGELGALGLLSIAVAAVAGLSLLWMEVRHGRLSAALADGPDWMVAILLVPIGIWLGHVYLEPGVITVGDANAHVGRVAHLMAAFHDGGYAGWSNDFYAGTPVLIFSGPLFHWLAAGVGLLVGDPDAASKAVLLAAHLVSLLAMFAFLRVLGLTRFAAAVGGLVYAGAFLHLYQSFLRATFPQALIFAVVPLMAWAIWRIVNAQRIAWAAVIGLGLSLAAGLIAHQVSALYGGLQIALFVLLAAPGALLRPKRIGAIAAGLGLAFLMACAQIIPIFAERDWLVMGEAATTFGIGLPSADVLASYTTWRAGAHSGAGSAAYLSYVGIALACAAFIGSMAGGDRAARRMTIAGSAALVMPLCLSLTYVRQGMFVLFALGLLAALGAQWLTQRSTAPRRMPTLILLVLLADLTSGSIHPLARTDKGYVAVAATGFEERFPMQRIAMMTSAENSGSTMNLGPNGNVEVRYPLQKVDGPHNITVPKSHNYLMTLLVRAERELASAGGMSDATRRLMAVTNIGAIGQIERADQEVFLRLPGSQSDPVLGAYIALPGATPIVFAPELRVVEAPADADTGTFWRETFETAVPIPALASAQAALDTVARTLLESPTPEMSSALPVREFVVAPVNEGAAPALTHGRLLAYSVDRASVSMQVETNGAGYIRLAHPYYPALRVTVNGDSSPVQPDPLGMMVVPIGAGTSTVEIRAVRTPLRHWCGAVAIATLVIALGAGAVLATRARADSRAA